MRTQEVETPAGTGRDTDMWHLAFEGDDRTLCGMRVAPDEPRDDSAPVDCVVCAAIQRGWGLA